MNTKKEYFLTLEDFKFSLTFNESNASIDQRLKEVGKHKLKHFLEYYKIKITEEKAQCFIDDILTGKSNTLPQINIFDPETLHFVYYKPKQSILKFQKYFEKKGFHLIDYFLDISQKAKLNYFTKTLTNIFNTLYVNQNNYNPEPTKVLTLLKKLSNSPQKTRIPETLQLFEICFNKEKLYSKENLLDIFFEFSKTYKSFPKTSFKKITELSNKFKKSCPEHWNELLKDDEFNKRFNNKTQNTYETNDCISKHFFFDVNLLSVNNGGFKINEFKSSFNELFSFLTNYSNKPENKTSVLYKCERSFLNFYILLDDHPKNTQKMENFEQLIQIVYENSCKNIKLQESDIEKMFNNISLMHKLNKDLNEEPIKKAKTRKI